MSCTLISNFEQVFPGNDRVQGGFLLFLTLNISFGREGKRLLSPTTLSLTYVRESGTIIQLEKILEDVQVDDSDSENVLTARDIQL